MSQSPAKSARSGWERARDRRGIELGRALDRTFLAALRSDRYDPHAFDRHRDTCLATAADEWERLEILRRHASRCFGLAESHERPLREITRLFEQQRRLGFSSVLDEWLTIGLYAKALADHGKRAAGRRLLKEMAARFAARHGELGAIRATLKKDIRTYG